MKKLLIYSGISFAVLILLYFTVSVALVQLTGARAAEGRAGIAAAGDHVYLTDYAADPIPDDQNAYHYLMLAEPDLNAFDAAYASSPDLDCRLTPEQVDRLADLVADHQGLYTRLEEAAACTEYRPDVDYSKGVAMLMSHVTHFRTANRALSAKALVAAYRGDGDAALSHCRVSLQLSAQRRIGTHVGQPLGERGLSSHHLLYRQSRTPRRRDDA